MDFVDALGTERPWSAELTFERELSNESIDSAGRGIGIGVEPDGTAHEEALVRTVDNERYPAFFELRGHRYVVRIEKASKD